MKFCCLTLLFLLNEEACIRKVLKQSFSFLTRRRVLERYSWGFLEPWRYKRCCCCVTCSSLSLRREGLSPIHPPQTPPRTLPVHPFYSWGLLLAEQSSDIKEPMGWKLPNGSNLPALNASVDRLITLMQQQSQLSSPVNFHGGAFSEDYEAQTNAQPTSVEPSIIVHEWAIGKKV
ncbi:uncharacterized protein [Euphorbia lathyris]|uniref:uncharacterized protein isoform X2 n=1 Tax=Euphorbia lathyris TaxID=212925 RepID=UPI00331348A3